MPKNAGIPMGKKGLEIKRIRKEARNMAFNGIFAFLTLLFVVIFYREIALTTFLLVVLAIAFFAYYRSPILVPIFALACFLGVIAEIFAVSGGVWSYGLSDFFGVPFWLFIVWGDAALFIYRTGVEFERLGFHK